MRGHVAALGALLLAATFWGASFLIAKRALRDVTPEALMATRFALAAVALAPLAWRSRPLNRRALADGAILGSLFLGGYWLQTRGLLFTSPSRSSFLTGLGITVVPLLEALWFRVRPSLAAVAGTVAAVAGSALLFGPSAAPMNAGDLLTLACAIFFAVHIVLSSRFAERSSAPLLAFVQIAVMAVASFPAALVSGFGRPTPFALGAIAALALVNTALAFVLLMWGQARVTATEAAIVLAFEPVATAIIAVALGQERLTVALGAGGALIVGGMVLSQLQPMEK